MQRVVCVLPNASHIINGVRFASIAEGGMLSEEIPDDHAAEFCKIKGYELWVKPSESRLPGPSDKRPATKE